MKRTTQAQREEILARFEAGATATQLAKEYGISDASIYVWRAKMKKRKKQAPTRKITATTTTATTRPSSVETSLWIELAKLAIEKLESATK